MKHITTSPAYSINSDLGIGQSNWDWPEHLAIGQTAMHKLFKTVALEPAGKSMALPVSKQPLDVDTMRFVDPLKPQRNISGEQFLNRRLFNDALLVMHKGEVVHESYRNGMQENDRHVIHSCTKSLCSMIAAIAIDEGLLDPAQEISHYVTELGSIAAWQGVSLQHVLDMQAGIFYSEDYSNPEAHYWGYARAAGYYPPLQGESAIGVRAWIFENLTTRNHAPGTRFLYNSCLTNILGMALESAYNKDLGNIFEEVLYQHIGAESEGYFNTDPLGFPITEGQFSLRLRDFARCAFPMINGGKNLAGEQLLPVDFIERTVTANAEAKRAYQAEEKDRVFSEGQYKNKFWVIAPEERQFTMLGIHGQFAWFDLNRELMIVGMGSFPKQDGQLMSINLRTLWTTIAEAIDC
ncbi:MAG: serine hydrolase [Pseudomonadales bacterium]